MNSRGARLGEARGWRLSAELYRVVWKALFGEQRLRWRAPAAFGCRHLALAVRDVLFGEWWRRRRLSRERAAISVIRGRGLGRISNLGVMRARRTGPFTGCHDAGSDFVREVPGSIGVSMTVSVCIARRGRHGLPNRDELS